MANLNLRKPTGYNGDLATQFKQGIVKLASTGDLTNNSNTSAVTPADLNGSISSKFASPPPIGNVVPNAGTFTNLTINDVFSMDGGAVTDFIGTATLVAGIVTIANTNIAATDRIMTSRSALNASPVLGTLIYTITPGVSFTVASFSDVGVAATTDVSSFTYTIVRQV